MRQPLRTGAKPAPAATAAVKPDKLPAGLGRIVRGRSGLGPEAESVPGQRRVAGLDGQALKVTVKGQTFFLCCDGCQDELEKDPDKYLAKLKK